MKILSSIGARPQFFKAAVFRKYCDENGVEEILQYTGQHYDPDMSTKIFADLDVKKPDNTHYLTARTHGIMTGEILEPVSYLGMQGLLSEAELILTVSGGLQKEAYFHNCDCITPSDETEWVETISAGWNRHRTASADHVSKKSLIENYGDGKCVLNIRSKLK